MKNLVPSLETCQKMAELGWEKPTEFVWVEYSMYSEPQVWQRHEIIGLPVDPAPTLQEILIEIRALGYSHIFAGGKDWVFTSPTSGEDPTTHAATAEYLTQAAAEHWCDIKEWIKKMEASEHL